MLKQTLFMINIKCYIYEKFITNFKLLKLI